MDEPNIPIPASFHAQLQKFAQGLQNLNKTIETDFNELEQKLIRYKNHIPTNEQHPLISSISKTKP